MSLKFQNYTAATRNHPTGNGFLLANSGQIVTESIEVVCEYDFQSATNEQIILISNLEAQVLGGPSWSERGFIVGDSVNLYFVVQSGGTTVIQNPLARTVADINGDVITFNATLDTTSSGILTGQLFPFNAGSDQNSPFAIQNLTRSIPEAIEFLHNLTPNSGASENSLFDGSVNQFEALGVSGLSVNGTVTAIQQGDKSGGSYISAEVERLADVAAPNFTAAVTTNKRYKITLQYANPYKFTDSVFTEPAIFENTETVKPFYSVSALSEENNPNSILSGSYSNLLGNVGWHNESYNQGVNDFSVDSVAITDSNGDPLSEVDFSQNCKIVATISHPSADFLEFAECEFYLIPDVQDIKNIATRNADNIQLSNFIIDSTPTITKSVFGLGGAEMQTDNQSLDVGTSQQIVIEFNLEPNAVFSSLVDSFAALSRRYVITANVESTGGDANENNAVTLTLKEGILEQAPVLGSPYPVKSQGFYNHANDTSGVSSPVYRGCAEDDFLYESFIDLELGKAWQAMELKIQVVRDSDGATFELLERFINFNNYLTDTAGAIQINYSEALTQYLESPSRNALSVTLTGNDSGSNYEVRILWSLLASWRTWLAQSNAFVNFFDNTLQNNGLNNEWMRYLRAAGYSLRVRGLLIDENNVADFFGAPIELQDYDAPLDVTTEIEYYDSSGTQQTSWIANDVMTIRAVHTLALGSWSQADVWGWLSLRPFENEPNKRISTAWDWTALSYPLNPKTGETRATLSFPSAGVCHVEAQVNTSMINTETSTVVARIETPKNPDCEPPFRALFSTAQASIENEAQLPAAIRGLLASGFVSENICCPTCTVRLISTGQDVELYAFGNKTDIDALIADVDGDVNPICCADEYGVSAGCEVAFDSEWDALMLAVTGDTAGLTALVPSQLNTYSGVDLAALSSQIQLATTDTSIRFELIELFMDTGLRVQCVSGSTTISAI